MQTYTRKSTQDSNQNSKSTRIKRFLVEAQLLLFAMLTGYGALILSSHEMSDPGWSFTQRGGVVHNLGGNLGAWLSDVLLYLFGYSAWWLCVLSACCVYWSYRRLVFSFVIEKPNSTNPQPLHPPQHLAKLEKLLRGLGFFVLLIASVSIEHLRMHHLSVNLPYTAGGVTGEYLSGFLYPNLGLTASTLLLLLLLMCAITAFFNVSWLSIVEKTGAFLEHVAVWSRARYLAYQDRKLGQVAATQREEMVSHERIKIDEAPPIRIEVAAPPVQISERAIKEKQASLFTELSDTGLPPLSLLDLPVVAKEQVSPQTLEFTSRLIEKKLADFGVSVKVVAAYPGPVITRYEIEPATGVKGSQVMNLARDLARSLSLTSIRVVETIPGKNYMGLELPNAHRQTVRLGEILGSKLYNDSHSNLTIALGKDIAGNPVVADLVKMPHLLIAGTTGSGKSVGINATILSLLYKADANQVRLILIDPKMLEMSVYEGIPHLLTPVVTDMRAAAHALNWVVCEMDRRYHLMSKLGVRNLGGFNSKIADAEKQGESIPNPFSLTPDDPEPLQSLPMIVVVIDELADLLMVVGKKVEELIARIAQKARAAGIHLILATQRPSVDVITGLIKANIPTRIAFQVSSKIDSRTILDQSGAETLLGMGDMLYMPAGGGLPTRVHGAFVADQEVHRVVDYLRKQGGPNYIDGILTGEAVSENQNLPGTEDILGTGADVESDALYDKAVAIVLENKRASISLVQRHLQIGYNRAARLLEQMEKSGLVSNMQSNGKRDILVQTQD